jgi:two-component system nitrogen regulation response regulator GlnG
MRIEPTAWSRALFAPTSEPRSRDPPEAARDPEPNAIIGNSAALQQALLLAWSVAASDLPVLLVGASGTGKELFAQQIHRWSRPAAPFVDVNCAALPRDMIEAELFGHRRGAFTGAAESSAGLLEAAKDGTLFLDEVLSMPLEAQVKLLRVVEHAEVRRIGETMNRPTHFRLVAAVQDDVAVRVAEGSLRVDLLERLAGFIIPLPTLGEREGDIPLLAEHFATLLGRKLGPGVEKVLGSHSWPGNVRELRFVIKRAASLCSDPVIPARALAESISHGSALITLAAKALHNPPVVVAESPREHVLAVLAAHNWNAERSAQALGLGRTTLFKRLQAWGISIRRERAALTARSKGSGSLRRNQ